MANIFLVPFTITQDFEELFEKEHEVQFNSLLIFKVHSEISGMSSTRSSKPVQEFWKY